jgi:hypothetical protein
MEAKMRAVSAPWQCALLESSALLAEKGVYPAGFADASLASSQNVC